MLNWLALIMLAVGSIAQAQAEPIIQTPAQSIAEDASQYAAQFGVSQQEAVRRLEAQQASVATTEAIAKEFSERLAGISIQHAPDYRIVVLLTGSEPVAERTADGVAITFRTGAKATRAQAIAAMRKHLIDLRTELPGMRGAGYDQRTGEVVLLVTSADAARYGADAIRHRAEQVGGVPVRVVINELLESNMVAAGGERVDGINAQTGHGNVCTGGFVVTDGTRSGIATAAHCPDSLTLRDADEGDMPLAFVTQDGLGYRDVQINVSGIALRPLFYSDRTKGSLRQLTSWRNHDGTRAGDFVCHWGESTHYTCATVQLTDYAPPGALCGGPCSPTWVTVSGPGCVPGDSGGPVFSGTVALGIAKGINRAPTGQCNFYYYMSTDYLPQPWRLMVGDRKRGYSAATRSPRR
jgi:hypothetical protein